MTAGMDVVGVLLAARDSITEETWTQGTAFRGPRPTTLAVTVESATQWCATGAVTRAALLAAAPEIWGDALGWACAALGGGGVHFHRRTSACQNYVISWNDTGGRTWEDVWDLLNRAATLAKGGAGGRAT